MKKLAIITIIILSFLVVFLAVQFFRPTALPIAETGHRVFGAPNQKAAAALQQIFIEQGGLVKDQSFAAGPTKQVLFTDATVINVVAPEYDPEPLKISKPIPATAVSLVTRNPRTSAERTVELLKLQGFQAIIIEQRMEGLPEGSFAFVRSNAFDDDRYIIVFRWWVFYLGGPPEPINFP